MSTSQRAVMICCWGVKAGMACVQVKLCVAISQRFLKMLSYLKALYKCPGLLHFLLKVGRGLISDRNKVVARNHCLGVQIQEYLRRKSLIGVEKRENTPCVFHHDLSTKPQRSRLSSTSQVSRRICQNLRSACSWLGTRINEPPGRLWP